jgi:hypothetical protein
MVHLADAPRSPDPRSTRVVRLSAQLGQRLEERGTSSIVVLPAGSVIVSGTVMVPTSCVLSTTT